MKMNSTPMPTHQQIIDIEHRVFHPRFSDTEEIRKALTNRGRMAQYFPRICPGCEQSFLVYGEALATTPRDVFCTSQCEKASKEAWRIKQRQAVRAEIERKEAGRAAEIEQRAQAKLEAEVNALLQQVEGSQPQQKAASSKRPCKQCGNAIIAPVRAQQYCSGRCREEAARTRPPRSCRTVACENCGTPIVGEHWSRRFCSVACRTAHSKKQRPVFALDPITPGGVRVINLVRAKVSCDQENEDDSGAAA